MLRSIRARFGQVKWDRDGLDCPLKEKHRSACQGRCHVLELGPSHQDRYTRGSNDPDQHGKGYESPVQHHRQAEQRLPGDGLPRSVNIRIEFRRVVEVPTPSQAGSHHDQEQTQPKRQPPLEWSRYRRDQISSTSRPTTLL